MYLERARHRRADAGDVLVLWGDWQDGCGESGERRGRAAVSVGFRLRGVGHPAVGILQLRVECAGGRLICTPGEPFQCLSELLDWGAGYIRDWDDRQG